MFPVLQELMVYLKREVNPTDSQLGRFCHTGDIWKYLETFGGFMCHYSCPVGRDKACCRTCYHAQAHLPENDPAEMAMVPRLRNPGGSQGCMLRKPRGASGAACEIAQVGNTSVTIMEGSSEEAALTMTVREFSCGWEEGGVCGWAGQVCEGQAGHWGGQPVWAGALCQEMQGLWPLRL